jgi:LPS O-antigen subunit length determinant protein (WzzB/FepE family)
MTDQHQKNTSVSPIEEDEIDLIAIAKTLWEGRKTIVKTTLIFMAVGLFVAIFSEKEYTASTTFVAQSSGSRVGGSLGSLAAIAGVNLNSLDDESSISPDLYPQIVGSLPFQKKILDTELSFEDRDEKITLYNYYTKIYNPGILGYIKKYTIGLPRRIINLFKKKRTNYQSTDDGLLTVSEKETHVIERLKDKVFVQVDEEYGHISVITKMPEAKAAAELAQHAQNLLHQSIIELKIKKSKSQLNFIKKMYSEKEALFEEIQKEYSLFKDQNKNLSSSLVQEEFRSLQSEYDLSFSVLQELAKQLETQRIQVKKDTPVLTTIRPVFIPFEKTSPNRPLILFVYTFLGCFLGFAYVFFKENVYDEMKQKWQNH